ncbi:hypothetical protein [Thiohalophilus thiocyanatoxydans]|uniref:Uncharacterized protein n=1 Tax=Thiohalophilus thiocyanatoxydans TaxID=381308 RepID=A0A4R8IP32_9GAMM|nr:hypothetical protein [Thiohalophilus thiocyanatoxydans]TDY00920.1 hypothetical protein EDC23_1665 [Thiohalophilus thiocyanatoxydans]
MDNPFWFNLVKQWKEKGMGHYGVCFPFLAGAVCRESGEEVTKEFVEAIFREILNKPVQGYYCEVRWCGNIDEPVVSIEKNSDIKNKAIQEKYETQENQPSLAFTSDVMSMLTLDCSTKEECLEKLVLMTLEKARKGMFSKNNGVFGDFTDNEIEFIEDVAANTSNT